MSSTTVQPGTGEQRYAPRRRGDVLLDAIFEATLAELAELGYAALTMEGVAARAKASKASLYRRWSSRAELVLDAMHSIRPYDLQPPNTGSVREDLLILLQQLTGVYNSPPGEATNALTAEILRDPELRQAARLRFIDPTVALVREVLHRGALRGEVRMDAVTDHIAGVGPTLLRHHVLVYGTPIHDTVPSGIVDEILMPLISPAKPQQ
jgi:AcrR family transcriptional regulator